MSNDKEHTGKSLLSQWKAKKKKDITNPSFPKITDNIDIPLSSGQHRLWFLQQLHPENSFYNHAESYSIKGNLNENNLFESLKLIIEEHQILKACFPLVDSKPIISIDNNFVLPISNIDYSHLSTEVARERAHDYISKEVTKPFNLGKGPLMRCSLIKVASENYILSLNLHHIIIDEWSMRDLSQLIANYYKKLSNNESLSITLPEVEYKDFAHWDANRELPQTQINYWKSKLSGELPNLDLQTDFKRPLQASYCGRHITLDLSKEDSVGLMTLAKKCDTTPFNVTLALFYTLLFRHTQQTDILIGLPITNRAHKSLQNLLGFFVDTVVLRTQFEDSPFSVLLDHIKINTLETFKNKDIPFDYLVKDIQPDRTLSMNPFFQVMFVYNNEVINPDFGSGVTIEKDEHINLKSSKFDLTLFINEKDGVLSTTFEYATDLFSDQTIERFSKHFELLAKGVIQNSKIKLSEIPMLTKAEKEHFNNSVSNKSEEVFHEFEAIHHIIEDVAKTNPNAIAVTYNSDILTYRDLNDKADVLASNILLRKKIDDKVIALCVERSTEMVVGLLAILKAGCAYLPIDPEYPTQRIEFILNDAKVNTIVTQSSLKNSLNKFNANVILVDSENNLDKTLDSPTVSSSDLAYIIYTSGSSGYPKGVPISHNSIINSTEGRLTFYDQNPASFLLMSSIAFDSSKAGIFWTLCTGGNLVISEKRLEQDIDRLTQVIETNKVSHTLMLPSLYHLILENSEVSRLRSLDTIMVAGEACSVTVCKSHFKHLPEAKLYNEYGPTEGTVWCIAHQIQSDDIAKKSIPIGKSVAKSGIHLLDSNLNTVPFGAIGEIHISGVGLAGSYINRPDLTEKAYVKNKDGLLLYSTGDLGRYNNDSEIEFLGRKDQQIKIRGFRVEIDEIEKSIKESELVDDVIVIAESLESNKISTESIENLDNVSLSKIIDNNLNDQEIELLFESINVLDSNEKLYLLDQIK